MKKRLFISLFLLSASLISRAQNAVNITFDLTLEGAQAIMTEAVAYAQTHEAPGGAIAIVDAGGHLVLLQRLTGTFAAAADVSYGKARTAALFRFPSKNLEDGIVNGRTSLITVGEVMLRGGLPIVYRGQVIGAIGVSGAASADQDVEIAQAGLNAAFLKVNQ